MSLPPVPLPAPAPRPLDLLRRACARLLGVLRVLRRLWPAGRMWAPRTAPDDASFAANTAPEKKADKQEADEEARKALAAQWKQKTEADKNAAAAAEEAKKKKAEEANKAVAEAAAKLEARIKADEAAKKARLEAAKNARAEAAEEARLVAARKQAAKKHAAKNKNARAANEEPAPPSSSSTPASPAPAGPSRDPEELENEAQNRYWELNQKLNKNNVTLCLICYLEHAGDEREIKNKEEQINRHVKRFHKSGVIHCEKTGCFVFAKDGRQIGLHHYRAHEMSFR